MLWFPDNFIVPGLTSQYNICEELLLDEYIFDLKNIDNICLHEYFEYLQFGEIAQGLVD